ncbi:hypothetical protein EJB05_08137 [Eragrostis curvula]|uniref:Poly A polymerase head domain-containing protein n=1 Tax=Eragrostis curvula TaxID=38414 RepID=A0A5J9WJQ9_9POAL|nr:hypothetical protein EJB05_08137 [Eragrostis curvula]
MTILRRLADTSRSPSPALLPRLRSVASSLLGMECCLNSEAEIERMKHIITGFDAYLVGGCVRDLLLKRVPKDFDVITTASLEEIKKMLKHCIIVGRRFPICQVKMGAFTVEVSNFSTNCTQVNESEEVDCLESSDSCIDPDIICGKNSMKRDFTINSLFFNPMTCRIYDYMNGVRDLRQNLVCTVIPAHESFKEDPGRIAARLGFKISSETSRAIQDLFSSIITLPKARLMMEVNCMLSYGSAESSVRLLRNYGLLDILLPLQGAYMSDQMKGGTSDTDLMLMKLLAHLDKLFSPNRPCHRTLWKRYGYANKSSQLALLAFHSALITSPQDAQVVRAFAGLLQFGSWESTMNFLKQDVQARAFVPETLGSSRTKLDNLMEQTSHLVSLINSSVETLTCLRTLQQSVARYSETSQFSGVVFASKTDGGRLLRIFEGLDYDLTSNDRRRGVCGPRRIDYKSLKDGDPDERMLLYQERLSRILPIERILHCPCYFNHAEAAIVTANSCNSICRVPAARCAALERTPKVPRAKAAVKPRDRPAACSPALGRTGAPLIHPTAAPHLRPRPCHDYAPTTPRPLAVAFVLVASSPSLSNPLGSFQPHGYSPRRPYLTFTVSSISSSTSPASALSNFSFSADHVMWLQMRQYSTKKERNGSGRRKGGSPSAPRAPEPGFVDPSSWRYFDSRAVGINNSAIPKDAWTVLRALKQKGFDAYLVGGCVRDLLLKRAPKDFDVITTASLQQIKKNIFRRCMIIGRRFPICQVRMRGSVFEVSSFRTTGYYANRSEGVDCFEVLNGYDDADILRWKNSMRRDFTINGLFFNPMNYKIYDYVNGVRDMRKNKVCTVIPAHASFTEDPARILRGLRIAARLGFQFSSETSTAIRDLSPSILNIDKTRLMMEMNYLLSYGAAEPSVRLLRKYGLLDMLLPFQGAYLSHQMKDKSSDRDLMLMKLLANLDKLLSADRPCHCSLWLLLLAFHSALVTSPQDTQVIRAFAALLYFGTWEGAVEFLKEDVGAHVQFSPETLGPSHTKLDILMEQTSHLASLVKSSVHILTHSESLQQSLARFPDTPRFSGLVFVSKNERSRLLRIFEGLDSDLASYDDQRRGRYEIDYESLKDGDFAEVRFVLGKVIMDTLSDELPCESTKDAAVTNANRADGNHPPLSRLF